MHTKNKILHAKKILEIDLRLKKNQTNFGANSKLLRKI